MNSDGSGQTRLTDNNAADFGPSWSPDGTKITFVSERDGNREIYVMNADGSGQTRLTTMWAEPGISAGLLTARRSPSILTETANRASTL